MTETLGIRERSRGARVALGALRHIVPVALVLGLPSLARAETGVPFDACSSTFVKVPPTVPANVPGLFVAGTAAAGTQSSGVKEFIETSHVHVDRIVAALTGRTPPVTTAAFEMPES